MSAAYAPWPPETYIFIYFLFHLFPYGLWPYELYFEDSKLVVLKTLLNGIIIVTLPLLIIITLGDCKFQVFSQWQLQGNVILQKKLFADEDSDDNNMSSGISSSESEGDGDDECDGNNKDISLEDAAPLFFLRNFGSK